MSTRRKSTRSRATPPALRLLPRTLTELPLQRLPLGHELVSTLTAAGLLTIGDVLAAKAATFASGGPLAGTAADTIADALQRVLHDGLLQFASDTNDWPTLRAQLLAPLTEEERRWLDELVGIEQPPVPRAVLAARAGKPLRELDDRAERLCNKLAEHADQLLTRLHRETLADLAANEGIVLVEHAATGSLLHTLAHARPDRLLGLRLVAFLFPHELHFHRGALFGCSSRRFRRVLRDLPRVVPPHRLPLPVAAITTQLAQLGHEVGRGALLHLLRTELHVAIEFDETRGEMAAADPRSVRARLCELLQEHKRMALPDLVLAWRERFRRGSRASLLQELRSGEQFVQLGPDTWAMRADHEHRLAAVRPLVDKVARALASRGGRHHVADLLAAEAGAERTDDATVWLVLDRLRHDPRVRMLGRGDACAATHRRSRVLETTLQAMRKAAGDVVVSLFLTNQPPEHRRLIGRLLQQNRLFVQVAEDRIDTIANWPFNEERLRRVLALVGDHLARRAGYAQATALKALVDRNDLGGEWLTPLLLADLLRRNGPFELLPGGVVARAELMLGSNVQRSVRQALREAGVPLSVEDVLRARPELGEFAACLHELLAGDPLVQSPDGVTFQLA